jgi:hypothetical protein
MTNTIHMTLRLSRRVVLVVLMTLLGTVAVGLALPPDAFATPANDDFADAQVVVGTSVAVSGTTATATREGSLGEPTHCLTNATDCNAWQGDHTVWYRWTAPFSGSTSINTCSAHIDSILAVYTGTQLNSLTRITDNNNGCPAGFGSKVTFDAVAGTTYRIVVGDAGGARENTFALSWAAPAGVPANDDFANAQATDGSTASVFGTNVGASSEPDEPFAGSGSVWYRWTAPGSGQTAIDTCTTDYDGFTRLYIGSALNSLTEVTSATNSCPGGLGDRVNFDAVAGTTYHVQIDGIGGYSWRTFTLELAGPANVLPKITPRAPRPRSRIHDRTPLISAIVRDSATDLSKANIRLLVDGHARSFSYNAATDNLVRRSSRLSYGGHTLKIEATDAHGGKATRSWTFKVLR